jgi:hypothetical protein
MALHNACDTVLKRDMSKVRALAGPAFRQLRTAALGLQFLRKQPAPVTARHDRGQDFIKVKHGVRGFPQRIARQSNELSPVVRSCPGERAKARDSLAEARGGVRSDGASCAFHVCRPISR